MAHFRSLFIFFCLISLISGQCTHDGVLKHFKRSVYTFSVNLSLKINLKTDGHFIASGLSPWTLLSVLYLGATEYTWVEIFSVLNMHRHTCFNRKFNEIIHKLFFLTYDVNLQRGAAIFLNKRLDVKQRFKIDIRNAGVCDIKMVSFDKDAPTAAFINNFISNTTHEAIDGIVTPLDVEEANVLIVDALSFKGVWKIPFPSTNTEISTFYDVKGNEIGDVNFMFVSGKFNIVSLDQIQAQILELPYGDQDRFSMLVFLPNTDYTAGMVLDKLQDISLRTVFALFVEEGKKIVDVKIPTFKITTRINNFKEMLIDMGLKKMFDSRVAKFENLATTNVYVSNFIQKADIEVTEDGMEAVSLDETVIEPSTPREQFVANKPFLFMIVDKETELPLLTEAMLRDLTSLIIKHTVVSRRHLTPELAVRVIDQTCPLWRAREEESPFKDPFWAFYWPGGQATARYLLDNKNMVKDRRVLDVGCGCGAGAIAAAKMKAKRVLANDIDPCATTATEINAEINDVTVQTSTENFIGSKCDDFDTLLIGDMFYDEQFSNMLFDWLLTLSGEGKMVLIGDPGRHGLTDKRRKHIKMLAKYVLPKESCIENHGFTETTLWMVNNNK